MNLNPLDCALYIVGVIAFVLLCYYTIIIKPKYRADMIEMFIQLFIGATGGVVVSTVMAYHFDYIMDIMSLMGLSLIFISFMLFFLIRLKEAVNE